jgi:hypothetical protein
MNKEDMILALSAARVSSLQSMLTYHIGRLQRGTVSINQMRQELATSWRTIEGNYIKAPAMLEYGDRCES